MNGILTRNLESSEVHPSSAKTIEIDGRGKIWSVAFLIDGKHVVSGDERGKIRRWRVEDGMRVGTPMAAGSSVLDIAVSRDGKWIVSGTRGGQVQVWNVESGGKVREFKGDSRWAVCALDVSPDSTRIANELGNGTVCVRSLSTGQQLLDPWKHGCSAGAVKFSPDGRFIATAVLFSILIYDSEDDDLVVRVLIEVSSSPNNSLAWSSNSKQLFAVSSGKIICLDASTGATLSQWSIHGHEYNRIALASHGAFIAASSGSSITFWDTTTHEQIGSVIELTGKVECMTISTNNDIVIGSDEKITLRSLCDILPSSYCDAVSTFELRTQFAAQ